MGTKFSSGAAFEMIVPVHPRGTDPSRNDKAFNQPSPIRETATQTWVRRNNGSGLVGRMAVGGLNIDPASAEITCTQANVEVGRHILRVGDYELLPGVDFLVGASDTALASNLATAISALPGFSATSALGVVSVETTTGHGNLNRIEIVENSAASAFALGTLDTTGFMDRGDPTVTAPALS